MFHNKLVKTLNDSAISTGLVAGIGWVAKKVIKEPMTSDPSSNLMNYAEKRYLEEKKIFHLENASRLTMNAIK